MGKRRRRVVQRLANERQEPTIAPNPTLTNENSVRLEEVYKPPVLAPEITSSIEEPRFMTTEVIELEVTPTEAIAKKKPAKKRTPRKRKTKSS